MAGGLGTRFWPISRKSLPKQFLDFTGTGKTFLRRTYDRLLETVPEDNIIVVTLKEYRVYVQQQIPELPERNILEELYNRNTAPCIAYASKVILARDPQAVIVTTPADHIIIGKEQFDKTLRMALKRATQADELITIGIVPTRPDSNFGYIQVAGGREAIETALPVRVKTFTEKPSKELAAVFIETGEFLWNSGIFIWKASVILDELGKLAPEIMSLWNEFTDVDRIYTDCPRISIDYAVMEKTGKASVIPAKFGWADIGNWESLYDYMAKPDKSGNVNNIRGKHLFKGTSNSILYSSATGKLIAVQGLQDMIVVDTEDVLMICPRDEKKLKEFITELAMPEFEDYR